MTNTAIEISDFYKNEQKIANFCINDEIKRVVNILQGRLEACNTQVNIHENGKFKINSYKYAFANTIIIIIDNALNIFEQRNIKDPIIDIVIQAANTNISISIQDNGGGISIVPLESIFEYSVTSKQDGSGLGLCLAKNIVQAKLDGNIFASNKENGAIFTVLLHT